MINMFTSSGYFEKEENHFWTMERITRALKMEGRFLIDVINPDIIIKNFRRRERSRSGDFLVLEDREFDYGRSRIIKRWTICRLCEKDEFLKYWWQRVSHFVCSISVSYAR
ncbi:MAG: hypothetical protein V2G50_00945 [bacterium JZ-2024 1]